MPKLPADKTELFERTPIPRALMQMAVPTIISQIVNLVYNMVDAFFIGRTGNAYMMAATSLTLTLVMMNTALSNLFGIGGGSLIARLMGAHKEEEAKQVSAFAFYGACALALAYALVIAVFLDPILRFLGASSATLPYARQYTLLVIVAGGVPSILGMTLAHMLRNAGFSGQASLGLSGGGVLNMALDPLFMFVLFPRGSEVLGAAAATLLSNALSCLYLLWAFHRASGPLSMRPRDLRRISRANAGRLFTVGIPAALLTGLFDVANISVNMLSAAHDDLVLAGMGIVMKVERIPNAVNVGICQGMMPIVAYNFASGNRSRMREAIRTARLVGYGVSFASILLFELLAEPLTGLFMNTSAPDASAALQTLAHAAFFLRIRCIASPLQMTNYHSSYCMQAMGAGKSTLIHAVVRELVFYIPFQFILDRLFGITGLAFSLIAGEGLGALFALWLLGRTLRRAEGAQLAGGGAGA